MIVYKLDSWYDVPRRGRVIKETAKQYKVIDGGCGPKAEFGNYLYSWNKSDCFADIDSASSALIARQEQRLESKQRDVDRAIATLDVARKWARREAAVLAEQQLTGQAQNAGEQ